MKPSRSTWILVAITVMALIVDQFTKYVVRTRMALNQEWAPVPSLSHFFTITYTTNTGAAFGLFKAWGTIFIGIAVVVITAIVVYQSHVPERAWLVRAALGLQLGGAMGNLVDRLFQGHVVDFIYFHFWPVFNVADMSIVGGVILLAFTMLREGREPSAPVSQQPKSADSNPSA